MNHFRIDLTRASPTRRGETAHMRFGELYLGASHAPLFDSARELLRRGLCGPDDTVTTFRDGVACLTAKVGRAADLAVSEHRRGSPRFVRHQTFILRCAVCAPVSEAHGQLVG